jgi:hypothetical protein
MKPEEEEMKGFSCSFRTCMAAIVGMAASLYALPPAHAQEGTIADNDGIFIDGQTFEITRGKAKGDVRGLIQGLEARQLGPSAIIFRSGGKLYIVDTPLVLRRNGGFGSLILAPETERPNRVRIEYVPPKNPDHQMHYDMVREHQVLENVQRIFSPFRMPRDLPIKTVGCDGLINAWYDFDTKSVTVCYELLQYILRNVPQETTPEGLTPHDAIVGQLLFWMAHEMGHALFDMYQTPMFGGQEDVADRFSAFTMLQFGKDQAHRLVMGGALMWNQIIKNFNPNSTVAVEPLKYYADIHGAPAERFYRLMCLAYGADPKTFADIVGNGYLPQQRAQNCQYEFQDFKHAYESEFLPHIDREVARQVHDTDWFAPSAQASRPK